MKTKLQNFAISLVWTIQSSHLSFSLLSAKPSTIQNMLLQFDLERSSIWLRSTRLKSFSPEQSVSVSTLDIETILYLKTLKLRAVEIVTALYQYYLSSTQIVDEGWRSKRFLLSNFFSGRKIELILWRHQLIKNIFFRFISTSGPGRVRCRLLSTTSSMIWAGTRWRWSGARQTFSWPLMISTSPGDTTCQHYNNLNTTV